MDPSFRFRVLRRPIKTRNTAESIEHRIRSIVHTVVLQVFNTRVHRVHVLKYYIHKYVSNSVCDCDLRARPNFLCIFFSKKKHERH